MLNPITMRHQMAGLLAGLALSFATVANAEVVAAKANPLNQVDPDRGFSRVWRANPDMDEIFARDGTIRRADRIRGIAIGDTKPQLVSKAGNPVSANSDGSWNFNIQLPLPQRNHLVCQYRVYFDKDQRVESSVWRRPQCADIIRGKRG